MGLMRLSYVRSMAFQSTSKFLPDSRLVFGSLLFIADKMGDLSLQEPESQEINGVGIDRVHPIPARDGFACEAQLRHRSCLLGESDPYPSGDSVDHHEICCPTVIDPIYKPSLESDSDSGQEVFMVGQGEPPTDQTTKVIVWDVEAIIFWATHFALEADKATKKRHRGLQDDSGA
jgi:hypothetical protein